MTVYDLVKWGEARFSYAGIGYGHGTRNANEEAVYLTFGALGLPFDTAEEQLREPLPPAQIRRIKNLFQQRIDTRKPAAYLLNKAWFAGLEFYVDERVLVPRSPIAELIEQGFEPWVQAQGVHRILDVCTGSGCIAIACALAFPQARVDATDISTDALEVARINAERHVLLDRLHLIYCDLMETVDGALYDIIVSNPPYVPAGEIAALPAEYQHEPALGLAAGDDGLAFVARILSQAGQRLADDGVLIVEVGDRREALASRFPGVPFLWLDFERGSGEDGVFLLEAAQVRRHFP